MSSISTYDVSVPILVRNLEILSAILKKGEAWAKENGKDADAFLQTRLIDDMLPLTFQIYSCCNTAKAVLPRIGGEEPVSVEDNQKTFAEVYARIDSTVKLLRAAKKEKFIAPDVKCNVKLGKQEIEMGALEYLQKFCLPNFFFHFTTAYNILRKEGVQVGKLDYLGASDLTTWTM
ncbi:hypothetical protein CERZMDRAFT_59199 [Cercospora zeae-maydis SCOH1-5]|uniref:DUF1993 domain-containing protein n=1 Tax=Cercospora zeae-maydis SCOH1-5 TaxID=717836 RepID=A0A6A6FFY1_9PEZI|nr:hypothetical protein CERZMDRAFT_59199 [Cercospora zeae-maydis SCOH1-5]